MSSVEIFFSMWISSSFHECLSQGIMGSMSYWKWSAFSDQSFPLFFCSEPVLCLLFWNYFLAIPCYCKMISSWNKRTPFSFYLISWTTSRNKNLLRTSHNCCFDFNHFCLNPNLPDFPSPSTLSFNSQGFPHLLILDLWELNSLKRRRKFAASGEVEGYRVHLFKDYFPIWDLLKVLFLILKVRIFLFLKKKGSFLTF